MPKHRPIVVLALAAALFNCNGCPNTQLESHPAFQLTYIDRNGHVRVRYSDDGLTWSEGSIDADAVNGVGASSSPDAAGVNRVVATDEGGANVRLWFGLGPANWDDVPTPLNDLAPGARPTIVDVGHNRFLIAFVRTGSTSFELWKHDRGSGQNTQVSLNLTSNEGLHFSPAMAFLPADTAAGRATDRVAIAWARYTAPGETEPFEIRTMVANINAQGAVSLAGGGFVIRTDSLDVNDPSNGPVPHLLSPPALAHDHTKFILASHQRLFGILPPNRPPEFVQMHNSADGESWEVDNFINFVSGSLVLQNPGQIEFAVQANCRMVLVMLPTTTNEVFAQIRLPDGTDQRIDNDDIFGANLPADRQFTLIAAGRPESVPSFGCTQF